MFRRMKKLPITAALILVIVVISVALFNRVSAVKQDSSSVSIEVKTGVETNLDR
jgi:hypothetical protein